MTKSKWIIMALVVSLIINLLLVGYLAGQSSKPRMFGDPTRMFPRWVRSLPEDRQQTLRPLVREHMRTVRPALRDMRNQHTQLRQAIGAEPFDADALAQQLAQLRERNAQMQQSSHAAFVALVRQLKPAERQALIDDLRKPRPPPWHRPREPQ